MYYFIILALWAKGFIRYQLIFLLYQLLNINYHILYWLDSTRNSVGWISFGVPSTMLNYDICSVTGRRFFVLFCIFICNFFIVWYFLSVCFVAMWLLSRVSTRKSTFTLCFHIFNSALNSSLFVKKTIHKAVYVYYILSKRGESTSILIRFILGPGQKAISEVF